MSAKAEERPASVQLFPELPETVPSLKWYRVLIFLAAASLFYPLDIFLPLAEMPFSMIFQFFTPGSLSLLAIIFCLMDFERLVMLLSGQRLFSCCLLFS